MNKENLTVEIVACPIDSYKLRAEGIQPYYEKALKQAKNLYLHLYENAYQQLMGEGFNPLWTPDIKAENDLDFKDDFGRVSYFFFNICLLKILRQQREIEVIDLTRSDFDDQYFLYSFFEEKGIPYHVPNKKKNRFAKHKVKQFVVDGLKKAPRVARKMIDNLKQKLFVHEEGPNFNPKGKVIYLHVHSSNAMNLKDYLNWRYAEFISSLKEEGYQVIVFSAIDFEDSDSVEYPFFNLNHFVHYSDLPQILIKALFFKCKVAFFKAKEWRRSSNDTIKSYFLSNLPTNFFFALKEISGLDNLFKKMGRGLLIIKGPINNKGASSLFFTAKKNGVKVLIISPRILTSTRFSNQFIQTHFKKGYPGIYPDSMAVFDQVSYEAMESNTNQIELHRVRQDEEIGEYSNQKIDFQPFRLTLVLQKKKEIEEMTDFVIQAMEGVNDIMIQLKEHPYFPIPKSLADKYSEIDFIRVLPSGISLDKTVEISDICLTSYSTAALHFVKNGKPVIWLETTTRNSVFFADLYRKLGLNVRDSDELREIIKNLMEAPSNYYKEREKQYSEIKKLLFYAENPETTSLKEIVSKELEKV